MQAELITHDLLVNNDGSKGTAHLTVDPPKKTDSSEADAVTNNLLLNRMDDDPNPTELIDPMEAINGNNFLRRFSFQI